MSARIKITVGMLTFGLASCGRSELSGGEPHVAGGGSGQVMAGGGGGAAGALAMGGFGQAGAPANAGQGPGSCALAPGDCRSEKETECVRNNPLCPSPNRANYFGRFATDGLSIITSVAVSGTERVAIAGRHEGVLRATTTGDGEVPNVATGSAGVDAFAVSLTPNMTIEWGWSYGTEGTDSIEALAFASSGDLIAQGYTMSPASVRSGFVTRINREGDTIWQQPLTADMVSVGGVTEGSDGYITAVGSFRGTLRCSSSAVSAAGEGMTGYVLRLTPHGVVVGLTARDATGSTTSHHFSVAPGGEDAVFIGGRQVDTVMRSFVEKLSSSGERLFTTFLNGSTPTPFDASTSLFPLAVNRDLRVTLAGASVGDLALGSNLLAGREREIQSWVAQLDAKGEPSFMQRMPLRAALEPLVGGVAVDGFGNIVVATLSPPNAHVTKLRASGEQVWTRELNGRIGSLSVASGPSGWTWVAGSYDGAIGFGRGMEPYLGDGDAFLLKL